MLLVDLGLLLDGLDLAVDVLARRVGRVAVALALLALVFVFVTRFIASARNAGGLLLRAFDIIRMHAVAAKFLGEGVLERDAAGLMMSRSLASCFESSIALFNSPTNLLVAAVASAIAPTTP